MKKFITTIIIIAAYAANNYTYAQTSTASKPITWVVEGSVYQPKVNTVKFYNDRSQLIYAETIYGKLDVKKKHIYEALNQACDKLYQQTSQVKDINLLSLALRLKY